MSRNYFKILLIIISISFISALTAVKAEDKNPPPNNAENTSELPQPRKYSEVNPIPHEAMFYDALPDSTVQCLLCPWQCTIKPSSRGRCGVRENINGKLMTLNYARPCTINIDPIEKKPFYQFLPGTEAFSLATAGCNLRCKFCQNWAISQIKPEESDAFYIPPQDLVKLAVRSGAKSIALTYSEPIIFYEYMLDIAKAAKPLGIKTVVVSNGFINPEPLKLLCKHVDAIKVDLKSFNEKYYKEVVSGKLQPVLDTLKTIKQSKIHLEIVYLAVPTLNDKPEEIVSMCKWIKTNLGADIPLHFSRFHPMYKLQDFPATPLSTVESLRETAIKQGLSYVYVGNVQPDNPGSYTYCPKCKKIIIKRLGYQILENNIRDGKCKFCGKTINGVWK